MKLNEIKKRFFTLRKCVGCSKILEDEEKDGIFCESCRLAWNVAKTESCKECFQSAVECTCQPKELSNVGSLCLRKLIFYKKDRGAYPVLRIVYRLKKKPHKRTEEFLAKELSYAVREELKALSIDTPENEAAIVYLPRSKRARRRYGIDQSERVVRALSAETNIPCVQAIIRKKLFGKEQKKLTSKARFKNIKKQFVISSSEQIAGKYVFLYDDVVTTGASMTACVKLLRNAGARGIICFCIARNQQNKNKRNVTK